MAWWTLTICERLRLQTMVKHYQVPPGYDANLNMHPYTSGIGPWPGRGLGLGDLYGRQQTSLALQQITVAGFVLRAMICKVPPAAGANSLAH
jgi:hypothetical protein